MQGILHGQELYVFTEPASNMPARAFGLRLNNEWMPKDKIYPAFNRLTPEFMWGINKNWMLHANTFISNMHQSYYKWEGLSLYAKYRFLSIDDVHAHFRMAAYAKGAISNNPIHYNDINLQGDNSGIGGGLVATQLLHKLAISFTGGYVRAMNNVQHDYPAIQNKNAFNYSLSAGYLTLPIHYKNYNQPNVNIYVEMLGKSNPSNKEHYLDIAPALQCIFKSKMRIDVGYRKQISGNMWRISRQSFVLKFEYNIFSAY